MIELDTNQTSMQEMNFSKIEHAMKEVDESVQHFLDRLLLGDDKINYLSLDRLRHATRIAYAEFEVFKKSYGQKG